MIQVIVVLGTAFVLLLCTPGPPASLPPDSLPTKEYNSEIHKSVQMFNAEWTVAAEVMKKSSIDGPCLSHTGFIRLGHRQWSDLSEGDDKKPRACILFEHLCTIL